MPRAKKTPPSFKGWLKDGIGLLKVDDATKQRYQDRSDRLVDSVANGLNRFEQAANETEAKLKEQLNTFRQKHAPKD